MSVRNPSPRCLTAAVVGAGIAGLSAAIALRRAGFHVHVYERSKFANEIGAAISAPPNATVVLREWGFDFAAAGAVPNVCTRYAAGGDLETLFETRYLDIETVMGAPSFSFHRVDLHRGLFALAVNDDGKKNDIPVTVCPGCEVRAVDCDNGILTLADGSTVQKDLVIIADGAHSNLLADFLGRPAPAQPTGRSIYRWLVAMKDIMADPELAQQYRNKPPGFLGWADAEKHILWVNYTCREGMILNNAVVHNTVDLSPSPLDSNGEASNGDQREQTMGKRDKERRNASWHVLAAKETVLETLANFHPAARRIVSMASEDGIRVHQLFKRPPLESFVRGRTAVVGDAAHVMMPTHAAGAAVAIESAGVLEVLFKGWTEHLASSVEKEDGAREQFIKQRLQLFDRLRIPRCNLTMLVSNAGPEGLRIPGVEEEIRRFYPGPLPPEDALPWSEEFRDVLFKYNAFHEATRVLEGSEI